MARIRSVKPEFWDDEVIGLLSRDARLLYIATWNMADDEGLLRWTASYVKSSAFMYDDDLTADDVAALMKEIQSAGLIHPYIGGKARQSLGWIPTFPKHQKPNRPQPSKLPPPSIQNGDVLQAYVRRDGAICHLCSTETSTAHDSRDRWPSLDHLTPRAQGGTDYPSNIRVSHTSCNKARRDRSVDEGRNTPTAQRMRDSRPVGVNTSEGQAVLHAVSNSVNDSLPFTPPEGLGSGGVEEGRTSSPRSVPEPRREDVDRVCDALADAVEANGSKRPRVTDKWRQQARLMLDADRRPEADVLALIGWVTADAFWAPNVMSIPTLREKYDQLRLRSKPMTSRFGVGYGDDDRDGPSVAMTGDEWASQTPRSSA